MKNLKPFDLQAALSGKAVMLRGGEKAFVRHHETELDTPEGHRLLGYIDCGEMVTWCENGDYLTGVATYAADIIGMHPETRAINGFEVPAPETQEPSLGSRYYLADTRLIGFCSEECWGDENIDKIWLERGLVFLNKEDAIASAKAMLGIDPYEGDES